MVSFFFFFFVKKKLHTLLLLYLLRYLFIINNVYNVYTIFVLPKKYKKYLFSNILVIASLNFQVSASFLYKLFTSFFFFNFFKLIK